MIDILTNINENLAVIFYKVLYMSMIGSLAGVLIFTLIKIFDNKLSEKSKCIMWIIPIILLLMPINRIQINTGSNIAISTAIDRVETALNDVSKFSYSKSLNSNFEEEMKEVHYTKSEIIYKSIPTIWFFVTAFGMIVFILGNININIKINMAKRCRDIRIKEILNECRNKLKIKRRIGIKVQDFNGSPCIYGVINTKILIPSDFVEKSHETLENIFMHELSHYKRKDMVTNYILLIITIIHWFNPIVHYLFKKIRQEMELATDEIALNKMNKEEKKRYGMTLINLLETYQNQKISLKMLCITDDNKNMERRIKKIKLATKLKRYQKSIVILVTAITICMLSPFILKTSSIASNNGENNINIMEEKLIDKIDEQHEVKETRNYIDDNIDSMENEMNLSYDTKEIKELKGKWKPYKAENYEGEISLVDIYGSGIKTYGGSLELRDDGTFTKFIGVYSEEQSADLVGNYEIIEPSDGQEGRHYLIILKPKSEKIKVLTYLKSDKIIIEKIDSETKVYYTK
ncbi:MAG: M56 family metallopeptidase [Clostridia bacterium]|nr:M56 family metallopeptidase [Clostridia bacterium]